MSASLPARRSGRAGLSPFGLGHQKPRHFREMARIAWENRRHPLYAWRVLSRGVCDGCALGTKGLRDWTLDDTHLCLVRLNLLRLNTLDAFDPALTADAAALGARTSRALRDLGRIPCPLVRRRGDAGFRRASWDEALADLGARVGAADPDRCALYLTSRGIGNEVYFAAQKAWRALGSPHVENAARLCHAASTAAMKSMLGVAASTCSYRDWYGTDLIVLLGSNLANDQPVAMKFLLGAKKLGTRIVAVNPYEEPGLSRYWVPSDTGSALFGTRIADRFVRPTPGGDLALLLAVQRLVAERGAVDTAFVEAHTENFPEHAERLRTLDLPALVAASGVPEADVRALADEVATARSAVFIWSMGLTQHAHGTATVQALCALALMRGFVGRERCGLVPIRGHSGVQGGAEMGAYATAFPGGVAITDDEAARLEGLWGFRPPARVGMDTVAMLDAAHAGGLDVLYSVGGNFLETLPQPERVEAALARVPLRIHQDIVLTRQMLVEPADTVWVLPARTRYEHRGGVTETTTERRVVLSPHVPGHELPEAREEWRILVDVVRAARPERAAALDYPDADAVRRDIAATVPAYADITSLRAGGDSFQYGGPHLCADGRFPRPGGRARFVWVEPPERTLAEGELWLGTRRGKQFNSMIQREVDALNGASRDHVLMAPEDMERLGLRQDDAIWVRSAAGTMRGRAFAAPLTAGSVQAHWPEANGLLPADRVDPSCRVPDYNAVVTITRVEEPR